MLQCRRAARQHLAPGGGRTGEGNFGDIRVAGERAAEVVLIDDHVHDAGRQHLGADFSEAQGSQRCGRGGLDDDRIAGHQRGRNFEHQQDHREVPRRDRCNDSKGGTLTDDAFRAGLAQHLGLQVHCRERPDHGDGAADLVHRCRQRLALFLSQQSGELGHAALEGIGQLRHQLAALLDGDVLPARKRGLCGSHGLVELIQIRARTDGNDVFSRWIDDVERGGSGHQLAIDQQAEIVTGLRAQLCVHALASSSGGLRMVFPKRPRGHRLDRNVHWRPASPGPHKSAWHPYLAPALAAPDE